MFRVRRVIGEVLVWTVIGALPGCGTQPAPMAVVDAIGAAAPPRRLSPEAEARVEAFCGDCHALPQPKSFPRDRWHFEVRRGYEFYAKSGRTDLDPPPLQDTLIYYRSRAPELVRFPHSPGATVPPPLRFEPEPLRLASDTDVLPEISNLKWFRLAADEEPVLLASDLRYGHLVAISVRRDQRSPPRVLAQLRHPGRVAVADLNGDGRWELIVADLGSYLPAEHDRGRVALLERRPGTQSYTGVELLGGLGRVADVQAADLDGDQRLDLVVAEFGWRRTGGVRWGKNVSTAAEGWKFEWEEMDDRPGAIDVRAHDFTGNGRPDVVVLFSQWHETIELFENVGPLGRAGRFRRVHWWEAPDLTFGSSGLELVDLNQDGRMDVLFTNGDTFDNDYATPWHGVQWLENRGGSRFVYHRLAEMPGAYRAQAGDFDNDGDLDIVVTARLPEDIQPANLRVSPVASIVLLLQTAPGVFEQHTLEWNAPFYPTLEVADFDGDGRLDFAVAAGPYVAKSRKAREDNSYVTIWWNEPR